MSIAVDTWYPRTTNPHVPFTFRIFNSLICELESNISIVLEFAFFPQVRAIQLFCIKIALRCSALLPQGYTHTHTHWKGITIVSRCYYAVRILGNICMGMNIRYLAVYYLNVIILAGTVKPMSYMQGAHTKKKISQALTVSITTSLNTEQYKVTVKSIGKHNFIMVSCCCCHSQWEFSGSRQGVSSCCWSSPQATWLISPKP